MSPVKVSVYVENSPEAYVYENELGVTIRCKPSDRHKAELLISLLMTLEGWDFECPSS